MLGKGLNLFSECAATCVHLSPQEGKSTSSSCVDGKMYRSGSEVNSRRVPIETNNTRAIAKVKNLVEQVTL